MNPSQPQNDPSHGFAPTQILGDGLPDDGQDDWPAAEESAPVPLDLLPEPNQGEPTIGHVGRYALKRQLGAGGLGRVYTAWDPILSRNLAIKTLQLGTGGADRAQLNTMILNEARAVAGLSHPNIVTVYDAGLSDRGVYIAMEQLVGRDLREMLAGGWRADAHRAAKIMRRVADALAYAHGKGVIHCDIKPANIFMVDERKPKVLDFGIARVAHSPDARAVEGLITGSPHYLSPEQLRCEPIDERCDVYAMGVVLYELLTGRKAFGGTSLPEITHAVLQGEPVPMQVIVPGLPMELTQIAMRAMARHPAHRYPSAAEMARLLRRWLAQNPSKTAVQAQARQAMQGAAARGPASTPAGTRRNAAQPTTQPAAAADAARRRSARRHRRVAVAAGAALLTLVATAAWLWPGSQPPARRTDATSIAVPQLPA